MFLDHETFEKLYKKDPALSLLLSDLDFILSFFIIAFIFCSISISIQLIVYYIKQHFKK